MTAMVYFGAFLLAALVSGAPTSDKSETTYITREYFPKEFIKYRAQHDIVQILVPLNALNFDEDDDDSSIESDTITIFFVEADIEPNGDRVDQGLYIKKGEQVNKLLDNGRDAAAANDDTKTVYFAAKEGLYSYNDKKNTAEKYGTVTDDLIGIAKYNGSDVIYVLTADHVVYKVTEEGTKKEKLDAIVNAQQIVLDYENNLYYSTPEKHVYVYNGESVKEIEGLPTASKVTIIKPPFVIANGVPVILDNKAYIAYVNGSSEFSDFELIAKPTAYAMEAAVIQYYAYNKNIYEYNLLEILLGELLSELKSLLVDEKDTIQSIATKSRTTLRA